MRDLQKHRHGKIEVRARRITPSAIIRWLGEVGRAEIGRRDEDRRVPGQAPLGIVGTLQLEARPAAGPLVEQRRAQRRRLDAVALAVKIAVSTRPTCH